MILNSNVLKMHHSVPRDSDTSIEARFENVEERQGNESPEFSFFDRLPIEVFLHICSFLEVKDMVMTLSRVCKRFHEILGDEDIWKCWIARRFTSRYPIIPIENDCFDWKGACYYIEKEWKLWKYKDENVEYIHINDVHISSCDAMIFINSGSICVSGSRDRSMVLWNPLRLNETPRQLIHKQTAHEGWIWRFMYIQNTLYSCSWDNTVKSWSLGINGLESISTFSCSTPALAMTSFENLVIAGDYGRSVYAFDPRAGTQPQFSYKAHQTAVLTLCSNETDIISGSEDKTIAIWDTRSRCIKQRIKLSKVSYPNSSCMDNGILYIGDNKGMVHVLVPENGSISLSCSIDMDHSKSISAIKHGKGYLITGSQDGTIKISLPTQPPEKISTLKSNGGPVSGDWQLRRVNVNCIRYGRSNCNCNCNLLSLSTFKNKPFETPFITELDYYNGMLAAGSANCVEFWIPKELMAKN